MCGTFLGAMRAVSAATFRVYPLRCSRDVRWNVMLNVRINVGSPGGVRSPAELCVRLFVVVGELAGVYT